MSVVFAEVLQPRGVNSLRILLQCIIADDNSFSITVRDETGSVVQATSSYANEDGLTTTITISGLNSASTYSIDGTFNISGFGPGTFEQIVAKTALDITMFDNSSPTFVSYSINSSDISITSVINVDTNSAAPYTFSGNILSLTNLSAHTTYRYTLMWQKGGVPDTSGVSLVFTTAGSAIPCIPNGQRILTQRGLVAMEELRKGDQLVTADGRVVDFKLYKATLPAIKEADAPIHIAKGVIGNSADIELSPLHMIQTAKRGVWVRPAELLATGTPGVSRVRVGEAVTYYHVEMPNYLRDNMVVEGCVVESFGLPWAQRSGFKGSPYTWNARLNGYTRLSAGAAATKRL